MDRPFSNSLSVLRSMFLVVVALAARWTLASEFRDGVSAYALKELARARVVFLDLAALGDGPSQYNLGAMALRGEGTPRNRGEAVGWMLAARENGHDPTASALDDLRAKLTIEEQTSADGILNRFGREALQSTALPPPCGPSQLKDFVKPKLLSSKPIKYPESARTDGSQAITVLAFVMGRDGRLRDPEVVLSIPPLSKGGHAFVDAATRSLVDRRYEPARLNGRPIDVWYTFHITFRLPDVTSVLKP
jgi:hypothetical protein